MEKSQESHTDDSGPKRRMQTPHKLSFAGLIALLRSDTGHFYLEVVWLFIVTYAPYAVASLAVGLLASLVPLFWLGKIGILEVGVLATASAALATLLHYGNRPTPCYLVDYVSFKPREDLKLSTEAGYYFMEKSNQFSDSSKLFQLKVLLKSGLGEETYGPPFIFKEVPPSLEEAREEIRYMMFGAMDQLLAQTGLNSAEIDALVTHVSMTAPAPSFAAEAVNRYNLRRDVKTFNLSGMGCTAGVTAVDLAKNLLRARRQRGHRTRRVIILGNEGLTLNWYFGNDRTMLVPNCIFRAGSYALLLSSAPQDRWRAKFRLLESVRMTTASSDPAYNCIFYKEDEAGIAGTSLSVNLLKVATDALIMNLIKLIPRFMPATELLKIALKTALSYTKRAVFCKTGGNHRPDFKNTFTHFCLHPGGRAVVDGIGKSLGLDDYRLEPSRMSLHRFGNTSSSGLWYAVAYCEAKYRLKAGDTVWQVSLGSGFKCNSLVWQVLRDIDPLHCQNPWMDCIHRYPVTVPADITPAHHYYEEYKRVEAKYLKKISSQ